MKTETPSTATIAIEGIEVLAYHGVYQLEREKGNTFIVDIYLQVDFEEAASTDNLKQTTDYQSVYNLVLDIMDTPVDLLETLVGKIGRQILQKFPGVNRAQVRVAKQRPMLMERCKQTSVEAIFHKKSEEP